MFVVYSLAILALVAVDLVLSILMIIKISKQEKFQTGEAHANLELINQSLNRLSDIAEKLEQGKPPVSKPSPEPKVAAENNNRQNKERQVLTLINRGENPKVISKKLGISRSEVEMMVASERLGNGWRANKANVQR
jgi:hypothetical protein